MMNDLTRATSKIRKGKRMKKGAGWRLLTLRGEETIFAATLLGTFNMNGQRIAVFSVPKRCNGGAGK